MDRRGRAAAAAAGGGLARAVLVQGAGPADPGGGEGSSLPPLLREKVARSAG